MRLDNFKKPLLLILVLMVPFMLTAQERCGTVELHKKHAHKVDTEENKQQFENWMGQKLLLQKRSPGLARTQSTYKIPVVVHIIHNGPTHATNISDAQVLSQISVLNKDFNRLNTDAAQTPAEFLPVAGSLNIEFVLAKQNPEGLPTNGIVRVQGPKASWTINDNYELKALSYWPAENYFNIWVTSITDYIGYAQFPQSASLNGLQNASNNRLTDGIVISYTAFGSADDGNFNLQTRYNKGRTATHETGHFFGLRHIWGDNTGCEDNGQGDFVADTPLQSDRTTGCPAHPRVSCGVNSMFQNYLDYTNDACMNLFTQGQVQRMLAVLDNSPRRTSLLTSNGLQEPQPLPNDLGVRNIIAPAYGACSPVVIPEIEVRNYGNNPITSALIRVLRNGVPLETKFFSLSLNVLEITTLQFSPSVILTGSTTFTFEILQTNGTADGNPTNNILPVTVLLPESIAPSFFENFNSFPLGWRILNPDQVITWQLAIAPAATINNQAMKMDFYNYADSPGEVDLLVTPTFDLSNVEVALLLFDVAYARFLSSNDGLRVIALADCNPDITKGTILYSKIGNALSTSASTSSSFTPSGSQDWRTESINLTPLIGQSNVQLAFVGINDYGNNLYLDNIRLLTEQVENLTLQKIISPGPVTCSDNVRPVLAIKNSGTEITSFTVQYAVNGVIRSADYSTNMAAGARIEVALPKISLQEGDNTLTFLVTNPNGLIDADMSDNSLQYFVKVNSRRDLIPLREDFEGSFENQWTVINPKGGEVWQATKVDNNTAIYFQGYENTTIDDEAWLVSPVLDFSNTDVAQIFFDVSSALRNETSDQLRLLASVDCGENFNLELAKLEGESLSQNAQNSAWQPSSATDWQRKNVGLSKLAGAREVRLAFVVTNRGINNLYLDNIEIFLSNNPALPVADDGFNVYPNPVANGDLLNIVFNLNQRDDVVIEIIDRTGKQIYQQEKSTVLNQTEEINVADLASGMYIIRVITSTRVYHKKFIRVR